MAPIWISGLNTPVPIGGLTVPAVTLVMAVLTALVGLAFGVYDAWKVKHLSKQLDTISRELRSRKKPVNQEVMDALHEQFHAPDINIEIRECWEEYKETLLVESLDNGEVVYTNTLQAEHFFTGHFVFHGLPPITKSLPGIATGLGLLGTFVALLCGLAELNMVGSEVKGIEPFINALSGKFFSSIAGLATALLLTVYINGWRKEQLDKNLHALQHQLNVLIPRKSPESILLELKKGLGRVSNAVGHLANDMAEKLPQVINETLGGDMQSLLQAINSLGHATEALKEVSSSQMKETLLSVQAIREGVDGLKSQNGDAITESIRSLMDEFKQGFHQSASSEMQQLTENLGQAAQFLQGMEASREQEIHRQQLMDERLRQLVESMQEASQNQQAQVHAGTEQMQSLLQQVVEQSRQMNEQGAHSVQEQLRALISQSQEQGQAWQQQIQTLVEQTLGQFQSGSQQQVEQLSHQSGEMAQRLDSLLSRLDESGEQQQAHTQQALSSMQAQLASSAEIYSQQTQQRQSELDTAVEQALTRLAAFMQERESHLQNAYQHLESTQKALAQTLSVGSQELGQTVSGLKETLTLSRQGMEQLNAGQKSLSGMVDAMQNAQQSLVGGIKDASLTASVYQQAIGEMQRLHDRQSVVYGKLDDSLAKVLNDIESNLEKYTKGINQGLSYNLKEWDKELNETSKTFAGLVVEVKDSADGLAEAMEDLAKRMPVAR